MLIILSFVDHDKRYAAVALLIIIALLQNLGRCGFLVNPQDVAPRCVCIDAYKNKYELVC